MTSTRWFEVRKKLIEWAKGLSNSTIAEILDEKGKKDRELDERIARAEEFIEKYQLLHPFQIFDLTNPSDHIPYKEFLKSLDFPSKGRLFFFGLAVKNLENGSHEFEDGPGGIYGISFTGFDFGILSHQELAPDLEGDLKTMHDKIFKVIQVHFLSQQKLTNIDLRLLVESKRHFDFDFVEGSDTFKSLRISVRKSVVGRADVKSMGTLIWKD